MLRAFSDRPAGAIARRRRLPDRRGRRRRRDLRRMAGGGGRTRTYEGLASGFTVRPLCHSGHSPMSAEIKSRGQKRPGLAEAGCGKAYVASRLGLSTGNMTLIGRCDGGASMLRSVAPRVRAPDRKGSFLRWAWRQSPACDASQPTGGSVRADQRNIERDALADQYGVPSLCAIRRWPSIVTAARSSSG
jgi:hypothetical protein